MIKVLFKANSGQEVLMELSDEWVSGKSNLISGVIESFEYMDTFDVINDQAFSIGKYISIPVFNVSYILRGAKPKHKDPDFYKDLHKANMIKDIDNNYEN